jgi:ketosteroid isomerase-like protein
MDKFLPAHFATRIRSQFVNGEAVCSINELDLRTPTGGTVTLALAEWFRLRGGKIAEHRVYYDPREFARAFGVPS